MSVEQELKNSEMLVRARTEQLGIVLDLIQNAAPALRKVSDDPAVKKLLEKIGE